MSADWRHDSAVAQSQNAGHGHGHDYVVGSPHLRHDSLRRRIESRIEEAVHEIRARQGRCSVLEIGAGHGSFTDTVLAAGATAVVTEMSEASYQHLLVKYRHSSAVRVLYDVDGETPFRDGAQYDLVLLISVLHHIPDYIETVRRICDHLLSDNGSILTYQDPLWYPRQKRWRRALNWGAYFAWRTTQGELRRGLATRWRRLRGTYSDSEQSDLVEYHVVRQGVDEVALRDLLEPRFSKIELDLYFSTQSPQLHKLGTKLAPPNTFGIIGTGHKI